MHKNRKTDLKNSQTENPNVSLLEGMEVVQKIRIQLGFVELNNGALHITAPTAQSVACAQCQQICWPNCQGAYVQIIKAHMKTYLI